MTISQAEIRHILGRDNPIILEIGAHKGEDTLKFLKEFAGIRIYSFEPDPRCTAGFKKTVADKRATLVEAAVSNRDGETTLHMSTGWPVKVPRLLRVLGGKRFWTLVISACRRWRGTEKEWTGSSSIKESLAHSKRWPWLTFNKTTKVRTVRLDTWAREHNIGSVDFMWVDVQGAERDLIEGAVRTLKATRYLYTEYGATSSYPEAMSRDETIELLRKHGFELIPEHCDRNNLLFVNHAFSPSQYHAASARYYPARSGSRRKTSEAGSPPMA